MRRIRACGILLMTRAEPRSFLLMRHADRWDLPKGRVDPGESDLACALREFEEETGVPRASIDLDDAFRFELVYYPVRKKTGALDEKTLVVYLATVADRPPIAATEHLGHEWFPWNPPHDIQARTINPLLDAVAHYLDGSAGRFPPRDP